MKKTQVYPNETEWKEEMNLSKEVRDTWVCCSQSRWRWFSYQAGIRDWLSRVWCNEKEVLKHRPNIIRSTYHASKSKEYRNVETRWLANADEKRQALLRKLGVSFFMPKKGSNISDQWIMLEKMNALEHTVVSELNSSATQREKIGCSVFTDWGKDRHFPSASLISWVKGV